MIPPYKIPTERREHVRKTLHYPVRYWKEESSEIRQSKSGNISQGGLMFLSQVPFGIGDPLWIEIEFHQLEGTKILKIFSRVIWVDETVNNETFDKEYFVGVQFKNMTNETKEILGRLMRNYSGI